MVGQVVLRPALATRAVPAVAALRLVAAAQRTIPTRLAATGRRRRPRGKSLIGEPGQAQLGNLLADEALDVADVARVLGRDQREGIADGLRPAGAADAVHIVLGIFRDVEIDDVGHAGDVDAARGDVGRDHDFVLAAFEAGQRLDALVLRAVRVKHRHGVVLRLQLVGDLVGAVLGAGKNQHAVEAGLAQQREQQFKLLFVRDRIERVVDRLGYAAIGPDFDALGILERKRGHRLDFRRNRGGEKQGLPLARAAADDVLDRGEKAHVEHAVHFVEDEDGDVAQRERAFLEIIHQAAGRGGNDIDPAPQFLPLVAVADATEDGDRAQVGETGEIAKGGFDLGRELAGWFEDEHAEAPVRAQVGKDRQGERGGFAGAGLGRGDEVAAGKDDGNGPQLDGRGIRVTGSLDTAHDWLGKVECFKWHGEPAS
jgi:hypothetical protein